MKHTDIKQIFEGAKHYIGKTETVCGWVRTARNSKNVAFIELNDGTTQKHLQIVIDKEKLGELPQEVYGLGASLKVVGTLKSSLNEKQPIEMGAQEVTLLGACPPEYPLQKKACTLEFLRTMPHLRLRTNTFGAMFRLRSELSRAIHAFFGGRGFLYAHTPIITGSDCEGAGEVFTVTTLPQCTIKNAQCTIKDDFFKKKAGLTVSGQLEGEAMAMAFGKIYTFGPTFRAENSNTARHAAEFWQIEPEVAFADLDDIIALARDMIKSITKHVMDNCPDELDFFEKHYEAGLKDKLKNIVESDFGVLEYTEAIEILKKSGQKFEFPVEWGCDLQTEHERYITDIVYKKPVFVVNYPKILKSFYMKQNPDGKTVASTDLLVPGVGEIIGASQREDNLPLLQARIKELGMNEEDYWWYLELRKFGSAPHSGFGLGLERMLMYLTGIGNIRDTAVFSRAAGYMM
jgi:asparaginyl-tRNA synthetase